MSGRLFAAVILASRTGDWTEVRSLIKTDLTYAEARQMLKELRR